MPAWMTSLLRELVPVPKVGAESSTRTSRPVSARCLATARPTTPAPITTQSALSLGAELSLVVPLLPPKLRWCWDNARFVVEEYDRDDDAVNRFLRRILTRDRSSIFFLCQSTAPSDSISDGRGIQRICCHWPLYWIYAYFLLSDKLLSDPIAQIPCRQAMQLLSVEVLKFIIP